MDIIPVIDVRGGLAVRAVAGERANYQPLSTPLVCPPASPADPVAVALGFRALFPFASIYAADLDGIEGHATGSELGTLLAEALPQVNVWVDAGQASAAAGSKFTTVIGSEVLNNMRPLIDAAAQDIVLSLDWRGDDFLGPPTLLQRTELWPSRVIVMTLARVGAGSGPDLNRIEYVANLAPHSRVYAAGGIRDVADLYAAQSVGAHGALVASALHAGKIKAGDLQEIAGL